MTHQKTKNIIIIDHDEQYVPIARKASGEIQLSGNFSLAEPNTRSRERLERLIDLILRDHNGDSVGVSHRSAAQVVYLAIGKTIYLSSGSKAAQPPWFWRVLRGSHS